MAARAQTEPTLAKSLVSLIERMRHPQTGVPVKDRSRLLRAYKACFVGSEMVSWLLFQRLGMKTRPEAVQLLRLMMTRGVFYPLTHTNKRQFRDSTTSFYRFYVDDGFQTPYALRGSNGAIVDSPGRQAASLHDTQPQHGASAATADSGAPRRHQQPAEQPLTTRQLLEEAMHKASLVRATSPQPRRVSDPPTVDSLLSSPSNASKSSHSTSMREE